MVEAPNMPPKKGMNSMNRMIPSTRMIVINEYLQYCSLALISEILIYKYRTRFEGAMFA